MAIMRLQRVPIPAHQAIPPVPLRNTRRLVIRWLRALVGHLEEEQVGQLLYIIAIRHAIIAQQVTVIPQALDNGLCCCTHIKKCSFILDNVLGDIPGIANLAIYLVSRTWRYTWYREPGDREGRHYISSSILSIPCFNTNAEILDTIDLLTATSYLRFCPLHEM